MKQKNIVIGIMCITVCIMVIGFAAFSTTLNINGTSSIESNWKVVFTNIQELSKTKMEFHLSNKFKSMGR